ncbi:uncharacterized protein J8A68_002496 [[Candida] subhashii]|uniref:Mtf2-like C-terminal domain-containing protein n=1 Tax=[Candida] subhashii TaxID=561895 RepID=A0A8J5UXZ9_9ASCO|nr:uncharacterized protein J8A68_002496 [[Candida] subhashii]KAG7663995.1 hypothetical protein J8A68_002496 [[Candida] subhashii]
MKLPYQVLFRCAQTSGRIILRSQIPNARNGIVYTTRFNSSNPSSNKEKLPDMDDLEFIQERKEVHKHLINEKEDMGPMLDDLDEAWDTTIIKNNKNNDDLDILESMLKNSLNKNGSDNDANVSSSSQQANAPGEPQDTIDSQWSFLHDVMAKPEESKDVSNNNTETPGSWPKWSDENEFSDKAGKEASSLHENNHYRSRNDSEVDEETSGYSAVDTITDREGNKFDPAKSDKILSQLRDRLDITTRDSVKAEKDLTSFIDTVWKRSTWFNMSPSHQQDPTKFTPERFRNDFHREVKEALKPSFEAIDALKSPQEVYGFITRYLSGLSEIIKTAKAKEQHKRVTLNDLHKETGWTDSNKDVIKDIAESSEKCPEAPIGNAVTSRFLLNYVLKTLTFKFNNPALSLSIVRMMKKDADLYILSCNQETFNEVLRATWLYYGYVDLYEFEKAFVEMRLLGHRGNRETCDILGVVVNELQNLSDGVSPINKYTRIRTVNSAKRLAFFRGFYEDLHFRVTSQRINPELF